MYEVGVVYFDNFVFIILFYFQLFVSSHQPCNQFVHNFFYSGETHYKKNERSHVEENFTFLKCYDWWGRFDEDCDWAMHIVYDYTCEVINNKLQALNFFFFIKIKICKLGYFLWISLSSSCLYKFEVYTLSSFHRIAGVS